MQKFVSRNLTFYFSNHIYSQKVAMNTAYAVVPNLNGTKRFTSHLTKILKKSIENVSNSKKNGLRAPLFKILRGGTCRKMSNKLKTSITQTIWWKESHQNTLCLLIVYGSTKIKNLKTEPEKS